MIKKITQTAPLFLLSLALVFTIHFNGTGINLLYMTIASGLLLITAYIVIYQNTIKHHLAIPLKFPHIFCLIWIAWLFISINWSHSTANSWYYSWILSALPFGFLLWSWLSINYKPQTLFNLILSIILFYAFWAIIEFLQTSYSTLGPTLYQGVFGALFSAALIPVISQYLTKKQQHKTNLLHPTILLILLLALFSTFSRGSILSFLMVLIPLFFIAYKQRLIIKNKAITLVILIVISHTFISQYAELTGGQSMQEKTSSITQIKSMNARLKLYQSMIDIYSDYPIVGTGIATFNIFYRTYRDPSEHSSGQFGHNDYLQYLQEGGPLLLCFLLSALSLTGWIVYRCTFKTKTSLQTSGYALASATFFIHAAADIIFYIYALNLLAGLFLSMSYHSLKPIPQKETTLERPKLILNAITIILLFGWINLTIDTKINTHLEWQQLWNTTYPSTVADIETLETYHHLSPKNPAPIERLAEFFLFMSKENTTSIDPKEMTEKSLHYIFKLIEISPRFSRMYLRLAEITTASPSFIQQIQQKTLIKNNLTENLLIKAINLDPNNNLASLTLAKYYQQHKQPNKALNVLNAAQIWFQIPKTLFSQSAYRQDYKYKQRIKKAIKQLKNQLARNEKTLKINTR